MILEFTKNILRKVYLEDFARNFLQNVRETRKSLSWHRQRNYGRLDRQILEEYFDQHKVKKLHIGCGHNVLDGWLNTNIFPQDPNVFHLNATEQFPFPDHAFNYVFSEHMIEHVPYSDGSHMLAECFRVLNVNGKIRISTPNLSFLIDLYSEEKTQLQKEYCHWINSKEATDNGVETAPYYVDTFVINNFVRDWGHEFIYDEKTLRGSLETAGFSDICVYALSKSKDESFRNLENEEREPEGFLALESIVMEGTKITPQ